LLFKPSILSFHFRTDIAPQHLYIPQYNYQKLGELFKNIGMKSRNIFHL